MVGLREIPSSEALVRTAFSVLPRCSPITRVGVFCLASCRSCRISVGFQVFPELRVYLGIDVAPFRPCRGDWKTSRLRWTPGRRIALTAHATERRQSAFSMSPQVPRLCFADPMPRFASALVFVQGSNCANGFSFVWWLIVMLCWKIASLMSACVALGPVAASD